MSTAQYARTSETNGCALRPPTGTYLGDRTKRDTGTYAGHRRRRGRRSSCSRWAMSTPTPAPVVIADKATVVAAEITDQFLVEGNDAYCLTSPCGRSGTLKEPGRHVLTLRQDSAMLKIGDQRSAVSRPMVLRQGNLSEYELPLHCP